MKGQLSVDPTFKTLSIRRPTIHSLVPLVAFDGHRLHLNNNSILWQSKGIINSAHIASLGVLMVLCNDWKLYIYNKNLELIAKLSDWQSKYSVGFQYIEKLGMFLLIGVVEVDSLKVNIKTNIKQTKFLSSVKFSIQRKQLRVVEEKNRLSWNKGYGYDIGENLLYVWSTQNINFYSLNKLQLRSSVTKLVKKEAAITYVHLNSSYKYTITGLINGNVKVWRLPLSPVSSAEYIMIHSCNYHTKFVEKIVPSNDDRVIISAANDLTICLWSLQTFQLLRVYNFQGQYSQLYLVDHRRAYAIQNNELGELTFGKTMEFITQVDSNISFFDKSQVANGKISTFQITLQSNVGLQIKAEDLHKKDLNKIDIAYFYPPLKAQSIKQVLSCPYNPQVYFMLVENGQLFSVKIENNSSKIQESFSLQHIQDSESHSLNQTPTFLAFFDICDIRFDSQITQNSLSTRKAQTPKQSSSVSVSFELKLITIGCSKGSIVILSLDNIQKIRARLTYHRESILSIRLIEQKESNTYMLASHCAQDYLRFISLEKDKANCFLTIFCNQSLKFCYSFQDKIALVFKKGIFQVGRVVSSTELKIRQNLDAIDHEGQILSLDYDPIKRLIMTSASDNRIKIWSLQKILIYEIKLDEGLKYAIWSNDLEILVLHRNKLLYLRDMHIDTTSIDHDEPQQQDEDHRFASIDIKQQFVLLKKEVTKRKESGRSSVYESRATKTKTFSLTQNKNTDPQALRKEINYSSVKDSPKVNSSLNNRRKPSKKEINVSYEASLKAEEQGRRKQQIESNARAARRHIEQLNNLKKQVNQSLLPKIQPKNEDKFEQFINAKLISKKMLTRRDITLNRIIMKNLIKEQFSQEDEQINSLKLDF